MSVITLAANSPPHCLEEGVGELVVELSNPTYDAGEETLTYQVVPTRADPADLPQDVGLGSVFIDSASG